MKPHFLFFPFCFTVARSQRTRTCCLLAGLLGSAPVARAEWVDIIAEGFESQTTAAATLEDLSDADPAAPFTVSDDDPLGSAAASGVQVVGWSAKTGTKSLMVRSGAETILQLHQPRSGTRYQLDFQIKSLMGGGDRNFYLVLRSMGIDSNGDDYLAYRADRAASNQLFYYQGIGQQAWTAVAGAERTEGDWQHHRFVIDMTTQTYDLFLDDMATPVVTGAVLSRPGAPVPTAIIIRHEGNSPDDGYFLIDDLSLKVEGSKDLATPFTEGFETYPAMALFTDDADPAGPWITTEVEGSGNGRNLDPAKVQVVDAGVVPARTGNKSLKIEGGQQGGVSYAWGTAPLQDVQVTWWARVPQSVQGTDANYLRMSLYGVEGGRADQGDAALLGYGSRNATIGDGTSLTTYVTAWLDSQIDYTPDTWEEYRLTTHTAEGTYSIVKSPSSAVPLTIADHLPFIGTAANWGPMTMVAWSTSNGVGHPPVYIDDIEIKAVTSGVEEPIVAPYQPVSADGRFTQSTVLRMPGLVGGAAVDPRDASTIVVAIDSGSGALYQVRKNAGGAWELDETPLVSGLSNPSGLVIDSEGTIWWTHDFAQSLRRLRAPWRDRQPEIMISSFGDAGADDDPIDLTTTGAAFNGTLGKPGNLVVADRDADALGMRGLYVVDPATLAVGTTAFSSFLVNPTSELGGGVLNAVTYLPATGEVVTVNNDLTLAATNAEGGIRPLSFTAGLSRVTGVAADPVTGRVWLAERNLSEIWSISPSAANPGADKKEVTFSLTDAARPDRQIQFNDPGLKFSPDGSILLVSDSSPQNRGGWLTILSGPGVSAPPDPVVINLTEFSAAGFKIAWGAVPGAKYRVLRSTSLTGSFNDISGELTTPVFTDPAPPAGKSFYRVSLTITP